MNKTNLAETLLEELSKQAPVALEMARQQAQRLKLQSNLSRK